MSNEKKGKELKLDNFKITGDIINGMEASLRSPTFLTLRMISLNCPLFRNYLWC